MTTPEGRDWEESPVAAAPSPGLDARPSAEERAFFDLGVAERGRAQYGEGASVRVQRGSERDPAVEPAEVEAARADVPSAPHDDADGIAVPVPLWPARDTAGQIAPLTFEPSEIF